ncbi:hypothetical protein pb186bvf_001393 [Paramecium bursaria]
MSCQQHPSQKYTGVCLENECQKFICSKCVNIHLQHKIKFFDVCHQYIIIQDIVLVISKQLQDLRSQFEKYIKIQEDWINYVITCNANVEKFLKQKKGFQDYNFISSLILLRNIRKIEPLKGIEQINNNLFKHIERHQSNIINIQFQQNSNAILKRKVWQKLNEEDQQFTEINFYKKQQKLPPIKRENQQ